MGITIQDVINQLTSQVEHVENTVDTLKFGSPTTEVTGIAVSFMPTYDAIRNAIDQGANLLITHEGLFYSHWDKNELGENQVYNEKLSLIKESGIAIYRIHDYIHRYQPDGIMKGLIQSLGWDHYVKENQPAATIVEIPQMTVKEIAVSVKQKLNIDFVRCMGDVSMVCTRIGLLAGYRGGGSLAIPLFENHDLDLVLYGEGPEWETPEYVRDAISLSKKRSLIVLGHAESEEPGMNDLANILKEIYPGVPVHFLPIKSCFQVI